jgi:uncharacterized protein (DUF433 family)
LNTSSPPRDRLRFSVPLYTSDEAARFLGVHPSTFATWARGYSRGDTRAEAIVTTVDASPNQPAIPFVGLVEGLVAASFRRAGVSMQHVRKSLKAIEDHLGLEHALASRRLYTDGAEILYDYAQEHEEQQLLAVVVSGQRIFSDLVQQYLQRIHYAADGWAERLYLPITQRPLVLVDPRYSFGRPLLPDGAPFEEVLNRFRAGEPVHSLASDFELKVGDVEDVIRAALPPAA